MHPLESPGLPALATPSPQRRRLLVGALALPLAARAADERVRWTDIELIDGRRLPAAELNDHVVVAQIWASWCPFCGAQNPHVQKLYDGYAGRGLRVVAFSIDRTVQAAREYVAKRGYTFPVAMITPQVEAWFGRRRTLPETYVVNRSGEIVFVHRGEMFPEDIAGLARFVGA
jgi:thiol-disulfide isomerase/thioredoxin